MAGLGRKVWTNETLAQPDLQGYLQDQVLMRFANTAARTAALPAPTEGMFSYLDDVDRLDYHNGATWIPVQYGQLRGKVWRTAGFSAALPATTEVLVGMAGSRLLGGFTLNGTDELVVPLDGLYDLDWHAYLTGNTTAVVNSYVRRIRASVANANVGLKFLWKPTTGTDMQDGSSARAVPLKAGDRLGLALFAYSGGTVVAYYGNVEQQGCALTATYAGPLNGATPI